MHTIIEYSAIKWKNDVMWQMCMFVFSAQSVCRVQRKSLSKLYQRVVVLSHQRKSVFKSLKEKVHPKMDIKSLSSHLHADGMSGEVV